MAFLHRTLSYRKGEQHIGLGIHSFTLAEFQQVFPEYQLSAPYVDREYEGSIHRLKNEEGAIHAGDVPWPEGDFYLAHADEIAFVMDCLRRPAKKTGEELAKAQELTRMLRQRGA